MSFRIRRLPAAAAMAAVLLLPTMAVPAQALTSSLSSVPGSLPIPGLEKIILVDIPGYGPYLISPEVQGGGLNPGAASPEDLLSAAAFSADFEGNVPARDASLQALGPDRRAQVQAGLRALHSEVTPPSAVDANAPIVVLGNGLNTDGTIHPNLANRLAAAQQLANARPGAPVLVSGGPTPDGHVEADAMGAWLRDRISNPGRIIIEDRANSTINNARYSRALLPQAQSLIVVTSVNHLQRAVVDFTLVFGPEATIAGVGTPNDPPEGMPSKLWSYRDALNFFLA